MNHSDCALYSLRDVYNTLLHTCYDSYTDLVEVAEDVLTRCELVEENGEHSVTRSGIQLLHCMKNKEVICVYSAMDAIIRSLCR